VKYVAVLLVALALIAATPDPTPPPSPPPLNAIPSAAPSTAPDANASPSPGASSSPLATPTPDLDTIFGTKPHGKNNSASGKPTPTPPPQRKGLDGVWEIQIQRGANVQYEHMSIVQIGQAINGFYLTQDKKKYPVTGSLDAENNVRLVVSMPDGSTILLEARVDGNTDMLGMFTDAKERVPFTAAYRAKENWMDNVNAQPAGLGSSSSGPP
jgi:hypothetical protein